MSRRGCGAGCRTEWLDGAICHPIRYIRRYLSSLQKHLKKKKRREANDKIVERIDKTASDSSIGFILRIIK